MSDKKELQRIIENITSTYNCFENDRCCNKTESEETEAELDEIIQFINNQDKQLQAKTDECDRLKKLIIPELEYKIIVLESEKKGLKNILADFNKMVDDLQQENTAIKQQLDIAVEALEFYADVKNWFDVSTPYTNMSKLVAKTALDKLKN